MIKQILKECIEYGLYTEAIELLEDVSSIRKFTFDELTPEEKNALYEMVAESYTKAVGHTWDKNKFYDRAENWTFYGKLDMENKTGGFIAVRTNSTLGWKLVMSAGDVFTQAKAMMMMLSEGAPVWGVVTENIKDMVTKKRDPKTKKPILYSPPGFILKQAFKFIPSWEFGGGDDEVFVNDDGSISYKSAHMQDSMKKYFVGNAKFYEKFIEIAEDKGMVNPVTKQALKIALGL